METETGGGSVGGEITSQCGRIQQQKETPKYTKLHNVAINSSTCTINMSKSLYIYIVYSICMQYTFSLQ